MAKVLVVEDNPANMTLATFLLESAGHTVVKAQDAEAGVGLARSERPDLILMDVRLPDGDGIMLTGRLKALPQLAAIPVLMLTGEARRDTLESSMQAGAIGFIVKPFSRDALLTRLDRCFAG